VSSPSGARSGATSQLELNWVNYSHKIRHIVETISISTPKSVGDTTQGVPSTSKSRETWPPVYPRICAHVGLRAFSIAAPSVGLEFFVGSSVQSGSWTQQF